MLKVNTISFWSLPQKIVKITVLKTVELPGSVAHLDASLTNVDADHFPLIMIITIIIMIIMIIIIFNNVISKRHENVQHGFLGGGIPSILTS